MLSRRNVCISVIPTRQKEIPAVAEVLSRQKYCISVFPTQQKVKYRRFLMLSFDNPLCITHTAKRDSNGSQNVIPSKLQHFCISYTRKRDSSGSRNAIPSKLLHFCISDTTKSEISSLPDAIIRQIVLEIAPAILRVANGKLSEPHMPDLFTPPCANTPAFVWANFNKAPSFARFLFYIFAYLSNRGYPRPGQSLSPGMPTVTTLQFMRCERR